MRLYKLLSICNLTLCAGCIWVGIFFWQAGFAGSEGEPNIFDYSFVTIPAISAVLFAVLAYRFFITAGKKKAKPFVLLLLMLHPIAWLIGGFLDFFIPLTGIVPVALLVLSIVSFWKLRRQLGVYAYLLVGITLLVIVSIELSNFEEKYCWGKGEHQPDPEMIVKATPEDIAFLGSYGIREGQDTSVRFREHMRCHHVFSYAEALREHYLLITE